MSKSVCYSVVPRKNPADPKSDPKYYAQARSTGDVSLREMCVRIQQSCTVTRADVMGVLAALEEVIIEALTRGEIVRLGELGAFQIGLSGRGSTSEEKYDESLIRRAKINFRPGAGLTGLLTALNYTRVEKLPKKEVVETLPEE